MRYILLLFILCLAGQAVYSQEEACPKNPDSLYNRLDVLSKLSKSLENSLVGFSGEFLVKNERTIKFNVFDLTDPSNNSLYGNGCVDFKEGHVYHFSPVEYPYSLSSIAILRGGEIKIYAATNCGKIDENLKEILKYLKNNSQKIVDFENTFKRTANYRRYAFWIREDENSPYLLSCKYIPQIPDNPDKSFNRYSVVKDMAKILYKHRPSSFKEYLFINPVENERAVGFYIQDLVDLDNKQTNLTEWVDFKDGHLYQFGWIDAPYSITHLAVLKDGKINFFEAIDCPNGVNELKRLNAFIKNNFKEGKETSELLERIKNYKNYRVSIEFNNKTQPRCEN